MCRIFVGCQQKAHGGNRDVSPLLASQLRACVGCVDLPKPALPTVSPQRANGGMFAGTCTSESPTAASWRSFGTIPVHTDVNSTSVCAHGDQLCRPVIQVCLLEKLQKSVCDGLRSSVSTQFNQFKKV